MNPGLFARVLSTQLKENRLAAHKMGASGTTTSESSCNENKRDLPVELIRNENCCLRFSRREYRTGLNGCALSSLGETVYNIHTV